MKERADLVHAWRNLASNSQAVLATVVSTTGSTYRKVGARLLIAQGEWLAGSLSGGCLEADLIQTAWTRTESGPSLVTYDTTADDDIVWGLGLGCNGVVQVLLERIDAASAIMQIFAECVENRSIQAVRTCLSVGPNLGSHLICDENDVDGGNAISEGRYQLSKRDGVRYLIEPILPPRKLYVFGAGHDAVPVATLAHDVGFSVTVIDRREDQVLPERFPQADLLLWTGKDIAFEAGSAAIIMSHHYLHDLEYLRAALASGATYVGLLGPSRRKDKLLAEMQASGFEVSEEMEAKLYSPIGLDLGAEGPEEIALAALGEILAAERSRPGGFLKGKSSPLHPELDSAPTSGDREDPACGLSA